MSCTLINGRTNPCNTISGIKRVYLFKYVQYLDTQIVCVPGSELISFPESNIYAFECVNATFDETFTNDDNGVSVNQSLSFTLKKQDAASTELLSSLLDFDLRFIVELNDGRYKIGGLYNGATVDNLTTVSGGAKQELNGYNITISANEEHTAPFVDLDDFLLSYNFIIEGVSSLIATKDDLLLEMFDETSAYYQGIVQNFNVNGDDVSFRLTRSEEQHQIKWLNTGGFTTIMKSYLDIGGNINLVEQGCFNSLSGLNYIYLPNMTIAESSGSFNGFSFLSNLHYWHRFDSLQKIENGFLNLSYQLDYLELPELTEIWVQNSTRRNLYNLSGLERCYMPKLSTISYPDGNVRTLENTPSNCVIYVPTALETSNGGNREQLIEYLEDTQGCTIVYILNETPPNAVNDLSAVTITSNSVVLSFTTPTSTNTVEFYEVWIDDGVTSWHKYFPKQNINASGNTLVGLSASTNYKIKIVAIDEYYNKSNYSNTINITTN